MVLYAATEFWAHGPLARRSAQDYLDGLFDVSRLGSQCYPPGRVDPQRKVPPSSNEIRGHTRPPSVDLDRRTGNDVGPAGLELSRGRSGNFDGGALHRHRPRGLELEKSGAALHRDPLLRSHLDLAAFQLQVARRRLDDDAVLPVDLHGAVTVHRDFCTDRVQRDAQFAVPGLHIDALSLAGVIEDVDSVSVA